MNSWTCVMACPTASPIICWASIMGTDRDAALSSSLSLGWESWSQLWDLDLDLSKACVALLFREPWLNVISASTLASSIGFLCITQKFAFLPFGHVDHLILFYEIQIGQNIWLHSSWPLCTRVAIFAFAPFSFLWGFTASPFTSFLVLSLGTFVFTHLLCHFIQFFTTLQILPFRWWSFVFTSLLCPWISSVNRLVLLLRHFEFILHLFSGKLINKISLSSVMNHAK